jgi:hypothetical protein
VRGRPPHEVAEIFHGYLGSLPAGVDVGWNWEQRAVADRILACRTARLGGHVDACDECGYQQISYNSCRNRHCPKCQGSAQATWLEARQADVLPVPYAHVVFTLPQNLAPLALEPEGRLRPPATHGCPHASGNRPQPEASRRSSRVLRYPAHLGPDAHPSGLPHPPNQPSAPVTPRVHGPDLPPRGPPTLWPESQSP